MRKNISPKPLASAALSVACTWISHAHGNQRKITFYTRNGGLEFCAPGYSVDFEAGESPASLFDNANDPYQYDNLAPARPDHPLMAELARRDAVLPWRDLEDDPQ